LPSRLTLSSIEKENKSKEVKLRIKSIDNFKRKIISSRMHTPTIRKFNK
jgi:hypothetical protein